MSLLFLSFQRFREDRAMSAADVSQWLFSEDSDVEVPAAGLSAFDLRFTRPTIT
jgi:hypothetical protein